jgi:hypothetical protein
LNQISDKQRLQTMCTSFKYLIQNIVISESDFMTPTTNSYPAKNDDIYKNPSKLQKMLFDEDETEDDYEVLKPRKYVTTSEFRLDDEKNE